MKRLLAGVTVVAMLMLPVQVLWAVTPTASNGESLELDDDEPKQTTTSTTKPKTSTTTTVESSTTSTTDRTTTTSEPPTTTSEPPTTTTTELPTTTTTVVNTTTTLPPVPTTSTSPEADDNVVGAIPTDGPPPGSGIREADTGMQADYESDLFGNMEMEKPSVMGVELSADYLIAVEVIEASWMWMLGLGLIIAWAIVSNVQRKRPLTEGEHRAP